MSKIEWKQTDGWTDSNDCITSLTNAVHNNDHVYATIPTNYEQAISRPYFTAEASVRVHLHCTVTFLNVARFAVTCLTVARRSLNIRFCRMTNYKLLCWLVETPSRDIRHNRMQSLPSVRRSVRRPFVLNVFCEPTDFWSWSLALV